MVRMGIKLPAEEYVMNGTRHTGTSVAVYKDLKEQILHLELPPGSAISEIDTAATFHVSRTPVRDAFKMLEREGLLEVRPHIGTFVSLIDLNMISRYTKEQIVLITTGSQGEPMSALTRMVRQIPGIPHPPAVAAPVRTSGTGSARRGTRPGLHH